MIERIRHLIRREGINPKEIQKAAPSTPLQKQGETITSETTSMSNHLNVTPNEHITTVGEPHLTLFASFEDMTPMIEKMDANLKRRGEREKSQTKEQPVPVIQMVDSGEKEVSQFEVDYDGHHYSFKGKEGKEEFTQWFTEYVPKAPNCITCDKIILPGDAVGKITKGLMHMYWDCCPSGGFYVGHVNKEGKVVYLGEEDAQKDKH